MDRTLDSTLLHLVRSRMIDDYPMQIGQCLEVITEDDVWWRPDEKSNALGNIMLQAEARKLRAATRQHS